MSRANPEITPLQSISWRRKATDDTTTQGTFNGADFDRFRYKRSFLGSVTPGYSALSNRQKMKLPFLDHTVTYQRDSGTFYDELQELGTGTSGVQLTATYSMSNAAIVGSCPSATHLAEAYTKARARLAEKVNNLSVNVPQFFAERRQLVSMVTVTAQRVVGAAIALRHGRLGEMANQLKIAPVVGPLAGRIGRADPRTRLESFWLEFQYGWKPLLQDAYGAAELLASHIASDRYNTGVSASATVREVSSDTPGAGNSYVGFDQSAVTTCRLNLTYRLDNESRAMCSSTGISNPALLAWELLPYSFVVDWFLPVGNYLQALDAFSGFQFVDGWLAQRTQLNRENYARGKQPRTWSGLIWTDTTINWQSIHYRSLYTRTLLTGFPPVGDLSLKNPIGGEPMGRALTALSLLATAFRK